MDRVTSDALDRREAVSRLLRDRRDLLVVTGLGSASYDVMAAGDHDGNFYLWGAMGSAAMRTRTSGAHVARSARRPNHWWKTASASKAATL